MRLALISDVHANREALEAVLSEIDRLAVDGIVHLGDAVGYGADPGPVCDLLARRTMVSLMGNHDAGVLGLMPLSWFSTPARVAAEWTQGRLSAEQRRWLSTSLPTWKAGTAVFSHGSPIEPQEYDYVFHPAEAARIFDWMDEQAEEVSVVFVGHAHQCLAFADDGRPPVSVDGVNLASLDLTKRRWVINIGSVGQPRDGIPHAFFATVDLKQGVYEAHRVTYDLEAAARKIRGAGLPVILADRLRLGM